MTTFIMHNEFPDGDGQWDEHLLKEVTGDAQSGWSMSLSEGSSFFCPADSPVVPKVNSTVRMYGRGFGYIVRGLFVDGIKVFYRTETEQESKHKEDLAKEKKKKQQKFIETKDELDQRYDALPEVFQQRIDKFRGNNPDFRAEFETYELFCCEQAVVIAEELDPCGDEEFGFNPEAKGTGEYNTVLDSVFQTFQKMEFKDQKKRVPKLADDHSGNTFGCSVRLAFFYLVKPENVIKLHGALAPLVGSEEYGCVPKTEK